jgi:hypothetical protein
MDIELDIGLNPDQLKIPKKWIGGSIRRGEKKKKEKKLEPRPKISFKIKSQTNIVFSFEFF